MLFTKLGHNFLVFGSLHCLVDPLLPWKPFLFIGFLQFLGDLQILRINGFFGFHAESLGRFFHGGMAGERLINRSTAKLQILLKLITGNKLGSTNRVEGARSAFEWKRVNLQADPGQGLDGVLIFTSVKATNDDLSTRVG